MLSSFDPEYLARLRAGDPQTEQHFLAHFGDAIRLSLGSRLHSRRLTGEVCNETFRRVLTFLRSDPGLDRPEMLGAYIHSVSINVMLELMRPSTRHPPMAEDAHQPSVDKTEITPERKQAVRSALRTLAEEDRQVLRAAVLEESEVDTDCAAEALGRFRQEFDKAAGQ